MRNYLNNIEIVGAVMVYREGEQCHWSLDWLYANCNRVCILLDNWDKETEDIVLEYKNKYSDITRVIYSLEPVRQEKNLIAGQIKKRFKQRQPYIRENIITELKKMHEEKPIDMLIWPDSDETFIDEFPKYLEEFWNNRKETYMLLGFIEPFDDFTKIISQKMSPHGRVFKYDSTMTALPWITRTMYFPYYYTRPWKVRNLVLHLCRFTEEYRKQRMFFDNSKEHEWIDRYIWFLPKDVRKMTASEIADHQPGPHQVSSKYPPELLKDYLDNKKK